MPAEKEPTPVAVAWNEIEDAYLFVDSGDEYGNEAYVSRETGKVYWRSEEGGELDELPEEIDPDLYVALPHKRDLDLGTRLVMRFADEVLPDHADEIGDIFSRKGAYRRFEDFLARIHALERWYEFENAETEKALREWREAHGLEVQG